MEKSDRQKTSTTVFACSCSELGRAEFQQLREQVCDDSGRVGEIRKKVTLEYLNSMQTHVGRWSKHALGGDQEAPSWVGCNELSCLAGH